MPGGTYCLGYVLYDKQIIFELSTGICNRSADTFNMDVTILRGRIITGIFYCIETIWKGTADITTFHHYFFYFVGEVWIAINIYAADVKSLFGDTEYLEICVVKELHLTVR